MRKYRTVATGGTFDHIHTGHEALLSRSFELGEVVVIGVTSDAFASREGKSPDQSYEERVRALVLPRLRGDQAGPLGPASSRCTLRRTGTYASFC